MLRLAVLLLLNFALIGPLAAQISVTTNRGSYLVFDPIQITYRGLPGASGDYITIAVASDPDNSEGVWYGGTDARVDGTLTMTPTKISVPGPGIYEARVYLRGSTTTVSARSPKFTISYPPSVVSTDKSAYLVLQQITVTYSNAPGYERDYITVIRADAPDSEFKEWHLTEGNKSGAMKFTDALEPGTYEARLHPNDKETVLARTRFTVAYPATVLSTSKTNYAVGEPVTVNYVNAPGYETDYITLVPASAPDAEYKEWHYTDGKTSGSMSFAASLTAGTWQARLHPSDKSTVLARVGFTVGSAPCSVTLTPDSAAATSAGGLGSPVVVVAGTTCSWTAVSNAGWIALSSGGSTIGVGNFSYTVAANTGAARTGSITVNDKTFTVSQAAAGSSGGNDPTQPASGNLVQNGDAEVGPPSPDFRGLVSIPGWTTDGHVAVIGYNSPDYPAQDSPGPGNRGVKFFGGGYSPFARMTQTIDLVSSATAIDTGNQPFTLSGWLGGWSDHEDNAVLRATFRDVKGAALGTANLGPVSASDRKYVTGLWERSVTGALPAGTRIVDLALEITRLEGESNDGYADNLFFGLVGGIPTSGGKCAANCLLATPGQSFPAGGGAGTIAVTADSTWDAVAVDNWIAITSGANGSGNGTVGFTVAANNGAARTGTIKVAGQTFSVNQSGAPPSNTPGCSYLIQSDTTQKVPVTGTASGFIQIITNQTCAWTATTTAPWISIKSGASGTGNGIVSYAVPQNETGAARSAPVAIAGQAVTINQDGGPLPGTPGLSTGGVVNTASYAPGAYGLGQGSYFSIYGSDIGPDQFVKAESYPLPKTLGGVGVQLKAGANTYDAYLVFAAKGQINAVLPSNVSEGNAQVLVTYSGKSSQPATVKIVRTSLGVFFQETAGKATAIAQNVKSQTEYPLNTPDTPAKPGQIVILWATGMGPVATADNAAPGAADMKDVPVSLTVGGVEAKRTYAGRQPSTAGVDNIYFVIPDGVPYGCQIPVQITAGGVRANTTHIAITADGSKCR